MRRHITLKSGREASVKRHHPWIFHGAIKSVDNAVGMGDTVDVLSAEGEWLASSAYSPHSQIRARIWSFQHGEAIDAEFFRQRLEQGIIARHKLNLPSQISACRLINAESDGLPGLVVDRYGDYLVCQFLFAGSEHWKKEIVEQLRLLLPVAGIYERSEGDARQKEGLKPSSGVLYGLEPPELMEIMESDLRFLVDIRRGHKTGFYLDQRDSRTLVAPFSKDAEVLNCFAYTGGFCLWALKGGADHVTNVDTSPDALGLAQHNAHLNGFDQARIDNVVDDVFQALRKFRDARRSFDLVILDPPKFAATLHQVTPASRGYKDINLLALKLIRPGGVLFTFSCSGHIKPELFQKIVADAALDAGREVQIIHYLSQAPDHPVSLTFPEGRYLKGLVCRVW